MKNLMFLQYRRLGRPTGLRECSSDLPSNREEATEEQPILNSILYRFKAAWRATKNVCSSDLSSNREKAADELSIFQSQSVLDATTREHSRETLVCSFQVSFQALACASVHMRASGSVSTHWARSGPPQVRARQRRVAYHLPRSMLLNMFSLRF